MGKQKENTERCTLELKKIMQGAALNKMQMEHFHNSAAVVKPPGHT